MFMVIGPEDKLRNLRGTKTVDPTYGMPAVWITPDQRGEAERQGMLIFDPVSVIATHLTEKVRAHASELLGHQEVQTLIEGVRKTHPVVVKNLVPDGLSLAEVRRVLQNLVKERVSIRDLTSILEALIDNLHMTKEPDMLTEFVRMGLARNICKEYVNNEGTLNVITLDPAIEQTLSAALRQTDAGTHLQLDPQNGQEILKAIDEQVKLFEERGFQPIVLTSPAIRPSVRRLCERSFPALVVLSWNEIAPQVHTNSIAMASL